MATQEKKRKKILPSGPNRQKKEAFPPELAEFKRLVQELNTKAATKLQAIAAEAEKQAHLADKAGQILLDEMATCAPERITPLASSVDMILKKTTAVVSELALRLPKCFKAIYDKKAEKEIGWLRQLIDRSWKSHS
eukprot:CAMPEP_0206608530 /NCGR_PEP_ID=MMETSP0325_2-20121206/53099_1 /ASSEMBLY_ACC=CAM_ASM_000347 /TAXON_ID=2866 /ORGANISM="Crypthecodinium cohnii, Strain Seligo" /LENGTH=135 /DNA_ID=CAMNT_0054126349 /DNA_START=70 /DNA_END=474 /DNA_ORIENTATION=+